MEWHERRLDEATADQPVRSFAKRALLSRARRTHDDCHVRRVIKASTATCVDGVADDAARQDVAPDAAIGLRDKSPTA